MLYRHVIELQNVFKLLPYSTSLPQESLCCPCRNNRHELNFNAEPGGRLADQEINRFLWKKKAH
jgi:hypothetical protein